MHPALPACTLISEPLPLHTTLTPEYHSSHLTQKCDLGSHSLYAWLCNVLRASHPPIPHHPFRPPSVPPAVICHPRCQQADH
jgi:hypothetical protein